MPFQPPGGGLNNTAEYMTSGLPWVSSSAIPSGSTWEIVFPYVTNNLTIHNASTAAATLAIGFSFSGSRGTNRFLVDSSALIDESFDQHIRVARVYLTAVTNNVTASIFASLTTIPIRSFPTLTGSAPVAYDPTGSVYENYLSYNGIG
jgi:hypothetical protein